MTDTITVLRSPWRRLAKRIEASGSILAYEDARFFEGAEINVSSLEHLEQLVQRLVHRPDCCVVRGALIAGPRVRRMRRLAYPDTKTGDAPTLSDVPRQWLALDVDSIERPPHVAAADLPACATIALEKLPAAFMGAACIAQATASHGFKPGCRLRLWFWLSRPLRAAELKSWLKGQPVDHSIFSAAQPIYTAGPVIDAGVVDPLPSRIVAIPGTPCVAVPAEPALRLPPPVPRESKTPEDKQQANTPERHARALIMKVLYRLEAAGEGERHYRLRAAACTIGGVLHAANVSELNASGALLNAAIRAGAEDIDAAADTIAWGLAKGAAFPLQLGGQ